MIYLLSIYANYILKGEAFIDAGAFCTSLTIFTLFTIVLIFANLIKRKVPIWIYITYVINTIMTFAIPLMFVVK